MGNVQSIDHMIERQQSEDKPKPTAEVMEKIPEEGVTDESGSNGKNSEWVILEVYNLTKS